MKRSLIISIILLAFGCGSLEKPGNGEGSSKSKTKSVVLNKDTDKRDSSKNKFTGKTITITVSYAAIACGCAHWFETKYVNVKFLEGVERFYLEPTDTSLLNANDLWDGEHLPLTLKLTGRFSKEKEIPPTYQIKDEPEKARIFWYDRITVVTPSGKSAAKMRKKYPV
jgi:hypothetical protein